MRPPPVEAQNASFHETDFQREIDGDRFLAILKCDIAEN